MNGQFKAIIWNSLITYFNTGLEKHVEFKCLCVAVDSPQTNRDVQAAAKAIEVCGYKAEWLPYENQGNRKHFIMGKINKDGTFESLSQELAEKIAKTINDIAAIAVIAPNQYK